jgi:hypothetical protein
MTEPTEPTDAAPTEGQEAPTEAAEKPDIDWKAKSREWERRAKENKSAAEELAQLKQSQMSDQERLTAQLTEAQQAAEAARAEALRYRIAVRHGINDEDAETFLTGRDEETLTRQAERLATLAQSGRNRSTGPARLERC